jgi:phosphatidylglycerophosphatase A
VNPSRGALERLRWITGIGFGLGHAPVASGTFGSLPGVALAWILSRLGGWPWLLGGTIVVTAVGIWAADGVARRLGRADPGEVVIDEVAGQMVTLLFLPPTVPVLVGGFLLFRILDIVKPPPARRCEELPGGFGIMMDDLVAGAYANLLLQLLVWWT